MEERVVDHEPQESAELISSVDLPPLEPHTDP